MPYALETKHILELISFSTLMLMALCLVWTRTLCRTPESQRLHAGPVEDDEAAQEMREEQTKVLLKGYLAPYTTKILDAVDLEDGTAMELDGVSRKKTDGPTPGQTDEVQIEGDGPSLQVEKDEELGGDPGPDEHSVAMCPSSEELGDDPNPVGIVTINTPGSQTSIVRKVPNLCSICLGPFQAQDNVTWSSNTDCKHVFHYECVYNWLQRSAQQFLQTTRRPVDETLFAVPALSCPCCRQVFIDATAKCRKVEGEGCSETD